MDIEIDDVGSIGVIKDIPAYQLPPEAWSVGENVRTIDDSIGRVGGYSQIFGTPGVAPYFALYVNSAAQPWWLYTSLTKGYVYNGSTHTDITRAVGGDYAATSAADWNGTLLGGIPIINNGIDKPQFWSTYSIVTKLADLTNWPATLRAKVIRAFGPYLMAFNTTLAGVNSPHNIRWSHPADPGSVPSSWDITDETKDAGELSLADTDSGLIVDALPLHGIIYVYKESSIHRLRPIGGRFIFDAKAFLETQGLLAQRCVCNVPGRVEAHFFVTQDDILLHDGNQPVPFLTKKFKRYLFNQLDVSNYRQSFVFTVGERNEAWFCYPTSGSTVANRALILNYRTGQCTEAEVDFQATMVGTISSSDSDTWASTSGTWDTDSSPWSSNLRRKLVLCKPTATKFEQMDSGTTRDGTTFTGTVQRTALGIIGRNRKGEWIEDFQQRKYVRRLWPKISGGAVNIRLGGQEIPDGPVTWSAAQSFDYSTQKWLDIEAQGAAIAIEFSGATPWQLQGYKMEMELLGNF